MEEHYTIASGQANGDVTENSICSEHGLNRREGHDEGLDLVSLRLSSIKTSFSYVIAAPQDIAVRRNIR